MLTRHVLLPVAVAALMGTQLFVFGFPPGISANGDIAVRPDPPEDHRPRQPREAPRGRWMEESAT
jgi:hypothetical protein